MKLSTVFGIMAVITFVIVMTYFSELILFLPALVGVLIFNKFREDEVSKYIGLLIVKPVASMFILFAGAKFEIFAQFPYIPDEIFFALSWLIPELSLTLIILRIYKHLFNDEKIVWLFLIGDVVRWVSLTVEGWLPDPYPEPYFYAQLYVSIFFLGFYPFLYAIGGLVVAIVRAKIGHSRRSATRS